tara:strand:+ start:187 stop:366 length:180 start_codon:yes stop_codon:yes gene_type:complete
LVFQKNHKTEDIITIKIIRVNIKVFNDIGLLAYSILSKIEELNRPNLASIIFIKNFIID